MINPKSKYPSSYKYGSETWAYLRYDRYLSNIIFHRTMIMEERVTLWTQDTNDTRKNPDMASSVPWFRLFLTIFTRTIRTINLPKFTSLHQVPAGLHGFCSKPTCAIRTFEVQNTYSFHTEGLSMPPRCLGQLSETFTAVACRKHLSWTTMNFLGGKDGNLQAPTHKPSWNTTYVYLFNPWIIIHIDYTLNDFPWSLEMTLPPKLLLSWWKVLQN